MKITKDNALVFAKQCIKRAQSISNLVKVSLEVDKKTGAQRDYSNDFKDIVTLKSLADRAMKLLEQPSPGYSFAAKNSETIELIGISVNEVDNDIVFSEAENKNFKIPDDRSELHKKILEVKQKHDVSYTEAFNKVVNKK